MAKKEKTTTPAPEVEKVVPAEQKKEKQEYTKAFFTDAISPTQVSLVIDPKNPNFEPGRPAMFGSIGNKNVSVFVQPAGEKDGKPYKAFMAIKEQGAKKEDGTYADSVEFGTAKLVVNKNGYARLAIHEKASDKTIWANPRKEVSQEQLATAGLDLAKLADVKASVAAAKAAAPADEKKPAAKP